MVESGEPENKDVRCRTMPLIRDSLGRARRAVRAHGDPAGPDPPVTELQDRRSYRCPRFRVIVEPAPGVEEGVQLIAVHDKDGGTTQLGQLTGNLRWFIRCVGVNGEQNTMIIAQPPSRGPAPRDLPLRRQCPDGRT